MSHAGVRTWWHQTSYSREQTRLALNHHLVISQIYHSFDVQFLQKHVRYIYKTNRAVLYTKMYERSPTKEIFFPDVIPQNLGRFMQRVRRTRLPLSKPSGLPKRQELLVVRFDHDRRVLILYRPHCGDYPLEADREHARSEMCGFLGSFLVARGSLTCR